MNSTGGNLKDNLNLYFEGLDSKKSVWLKLTNENVSTQSGRLWTSKNAVVEQNQLTELFSKKIKEIDLPITKKTIQNLKVKYNPPGLLSKFIQFFKNFFLGKLAVSNAARLQLLQLEKTLEAVEKISEKQIDHILISSELNGIEKKDAETQNTETKAQEELKEAEKIIEERKEEGERDHILISSELNGIEKKDAETQNTETRAEEELQEAEKITKERKEESEIDHVPISSELKGIDTKDAKALELKKISKNVAYSVMGVSWNLEEDIKKIIEQNFKNIDPKKIMILNETPNYNEYYSLKYGFYIKIYHKGQVSEQDDNKYQYGPHEVIIGPTPTSEKSVYFHPYDNIIPPNDYSMFPGWDLEQQFVTAWTFTRLSGNPKPGGKWKKRNKGSAVSLKKIIDDVVLEFNKQMGKKFNASYLGSDDFNIDIEIESRPLFRYRFLTSPDKNVGKQSFDEKDVSADLLITIAEKLKNSKYVTKEINFFLTSQ